MYKTVRINERVKPFVINGRRVLYKSKKKPQILDLSQEEYDALKSIERSGKYQDLDSRCERLLKNKILRLEESEEEENSGTRYEKTSVFLAEKYTSSANGVLRGLQSKKVIILGLGGLGCMLLMHMVSLGIKDYVLIGQKNPFSQTL